MESKACGGTGSLCRSAMVALLILAAGLFIPACQSNNKNSANPPAFGGLVSAANAGATQAMLVWAPAEDFVGAGITYNVYWTQTSMTEDFANPPQGQSLKGTGDIFVMPSVGLWFFIVQAVDGDGNTDGNTIERSANVTNP